MTTFARIVKNVKIRPEYRPLSVLPVALLEVTNSEAGDIPGYSGLRNPMKPP